jgi:Spy/CpxP family protein refolding chaperone
MVQKFSLYLFILALITASSLALAGGPGGEGKGPRGKPEERLQRMQEHLGLSESQVEQIRAIHSSGGSREEKRAQMADIFTDEQRAMIEEHRGQRGERRRQGRPDENAEEYN